MVVAVTVAVARRWRGRGSLVPGREWKAAGVRRQTFEQDSHGTVLNGC